MATLTSMVCCGVKELSGISYQKPLQVLKDLCKQQWNKYNRALNPLPELIVFTGVIAYQDEDDYRYDGDVNYGPEFAEYLIKNKLGKVSIAGEGYNNINHPDHLVRVWLWMPDNNKIEKWWDAHKPKPRAKKKAA